MAYKPLFPSDWALENVLTLLAAWWLVRAHRRRPLSNGALAMLWVFGTAHVVGSHYTYAEVPYDAWSKAAFGTGVNDVFGATRNHYDRLVHFLFGLLCYRPLREAMGNALPDTDAARWLVVAVVVALSAVYEDLEWAAAVVFGGDLGQAYLGTQGDVWDAHKDTLMAIVGAIGAALISMVCARRRRGVRGRATCRDGTASDCRSNDRG